jgi:hypothetical protein
LSTCAIAHEHVVEGIDRAVAECGQNEQGRDRGKEQRQVRRDVGEAVPAGLREEDVDDEDHAREREDDRLGQRKQE